MSGWVKIHRKLADWGWSNSPKHISTFLHILMRANYKQTKWRNETIDAGQLLTGIDQLATWTGNSRQSVRTVIRDLISTGEITRRTTNKYSIITVVNWEDYQSDNTPVNIQSTFNQHSINIQSTASKKAKNNKNNIIVGLDDSFCDEVKNIWNDFADQHRLPKIKNLTADRKKLLLLAKKEFPNSKDWRLIINQIAKSEHNLGFNKSGWKANFDWLIYKTKFNYRKLYELAQVKTADQELFGD